MAVAAAGHGPCARPSRPVPEYTSRPRILVTNDDGVESRGLLALKQALEPIGDVTVVAPDTNQSAVGHQKTLMRPLRVRERILADGSQALLGRRLADRRREPRLPGLLRARLRPRRRGHQLRGQPRRRHHLLGHGQRGHGGGHQQLPGLRHLAGVLRASRLHPGRLRGGGRRPQHPGRGPVARRAGQRQRARPRRSRSARASRSPGSAGGSTPTSSSSAWTRAASPTSGSAGRRRPAWPCPAPTTTPSSTGASRSRPSTWT